MNAVDTFCPIFADADSQANFFAFRRRIEAGDFTARDLSIICPPGTPGVTLARWLGELAVKWGTIAADLLIEGEGEVIALAKEEVMLPGGRGRLHLVNLDLMEVSDVPELARLLSPFPDEAARPWWLVTLGSAMPDLTAEQAAAAKLVVLAPAVPLLSDNFPTGGQAGT